MADTAAVTAKDIPGQLWAVASTLSDEAQSAAVRKGMTESDFVRREIARVVEAPPLKDFLKRVGRKRRFKGPPSAEIVRAERMEKRLAKVVRDSKQAES